MSHTDEYNALRNELLVHLQINAQITWSAVIATGAILAVGLTMPTPDPFVFLAPLILIYPSMINCAVRSRGVRRIGCYIATFHEDGQSEIGWERRNWRYVNDKKVLAFTNPLLRFVSTSVFFGLAVVCLFLAWRAWRYHPVLFLPVVVIVLPALLYATRFTVNVKSQYEEAFKKWEEIKEEETANKQVEDNSPGLREPVERKSKFSFLTPNFCLVTGAACLVAGIVFVIPPVFFPKVAAAPSSSLWLFLALPTFVCWAILLALCMITALYVFDQGWQTGPKFWPKRHWPVSLGVLCCLIAAAGVSWPSASLVYRLAAHRTQDARHLKSIGFACLMYSGENYGSMPPNLEALQQNIMTWGAVYLCPRPPLTIEQREKRRGETDYVYVGSGLRDDVPQASKTVIAYSKEPGLLGNWCNFLFIDGHVEGCPCHDPLKTVKEKGWRLGGTGPASKADSAPKPAKTGRTP